MTIQLTIYKWLYKIACIHSQITIKLTIYIVKGLYNWLSTNDYTIDYIYIVNWLYSWLYTLSNEYTIENLQMTIQLTIYIFK